MSLGNEAFEVLDRPFSIALDEPAGWSQLEPFKSVHYLRAEVRGTTEELSHLAELPKLEALELTHDPSDEPPLKDDIVTAELPPLPHLRGLYLDQPARRCRRLDRLTSLEALRIGEDCIDQQSLREISGLPNLREVALDGLPAWADLAFLPSRPRLTALDLYYGQVSEAALRNIGQCSHLKYLSLKMCEVDGSGIRYLSKLSELETLSVEYTNVTSEDLPELVSLKRLKELDLTKTQIQGNLDFLAGLESLETLSLYNTTVQPADLMRLAGLKHLRSLNLGYARIGREGRECLPQLKQLKSLVLSDINEDQRAALQSKLPGCEVWRH